MDAAELEARVRTFVDEVWNGRKYNAAADLYGESYSNGLGSGPSAGASSSAATIRRSLTCT